MLPAVGGSNLCPGSATPHTHWNQDFPVSNVSLHWWAQHDHWSLAYNTRPDNTLRCTLHRRALRCSHCLHPLPLTRCMIKMGTTYLFLSVIKHDSNTPVRAHKAWYVTGRQPCGGPSDLLQHTVSLVQRVNRLLSTTGVHPRSKDRKRIFQLALPHFNIKKSYHLQSLFMLSLLDVISFVIILCYLF